MKFITSTIFYFLFSIYAFAQNETLISRDVVSYKADRLGNIYYIDSKSVLNKFEPKIKRYTKYADLKSGKISSIDVSNPLRIVVFYEDQATVKFLDINLTEIGSYVIRSNYSDGWISLVASSNNNGLWMYDNINRKIIKLGEQLNTQFSTGDLYLIFSKKISPSYLLENADELYLIDTSNGIFVFDLFGGYKKSLPINAEIITQLSNPYETKNTVRVLLRGDALLYTKEKE
jgi:hypothetical protein